MLTRTKPVRLLVGYLVGGFGLSLIIGVSVVFLLKDVKIGKSSSVPPNIEIAVGALSLLISVLVGTRVSATRPQKVLVRHPEAHVPTLDSPAASPGGPPRTEPLPDSFEKLPNRCKAVLSRDSPWVAWVAGIVVGTPNTYYVAAVAAILKGGVDAGTEVAALVVFNLVAFAQAGIPLVSFLIAPEATRQRIQELYTWISSHERWLVAVLTGAVGIFLVIVGASKL